MQSRHHVKVTPKHQILSTNKHHQKRPVSNYNPILELWNSWHEHCQHPSVQGWPLANFLCAFNWWKWDHLLKKSICWLICFCMVDKIYLRLALTALGQGLNFCMAITNAAYPTHLGFYRVLNAPNSCIPLAILYGRLFFGWLFVNIDASPIQWCISDKNVWEPNGKDSRYSIPRRGLFGSDWRKRPRLLNDPFKNDPLTISLKSIKSLV